jgi:enoyl-CoA hydratase
LTNASGTPDPAADEAGSAEQHPVLVESGGGVMVITINRPHAKNAVTMAVSEGVAAALDELDQRDDLVVGIITGAGGTFCAGMDLKAFAQGVRPNLPGRGFCGITEAPPAKPFIAAVEGYALAGGCEVALASDMIVAGRGAKFGIPEAKRGLAAAAGGLLRLPERIPPNIAMELALTGDFLPAPRAHEMGLVNRLTEDGGALAAARELAASIAANGPLAVRASKTVIRESPAWPRDQQFKRQWEILDEVFSSQDAKEGAIAFAEKREPRWQGK